VKIDAMSDIFISYSKADHALALKLSAFLEDRRMDRLLEP
jgi:hypothetical protein